MCVSVSVSQNDGGGTVRKHKKESSCSRTLNMYKSLYMISTLQLVLNKYIFPLKFRITDFRLSSKRQSFLQGITTGSDYKENLIL